MARHPDLRADERTTLEQFLDQQREIVLEKVEGLDDDQVHARILPATELTMAGVVKHLANVEDGWVQGRLLGTELPEPWASAPFDEDVDWEFHSAVDDSLDDLRRLYLDACARSRATLATFDSLDTPAAVPSFGKGPVSVRWVLVHLVEETARHLGHLDLLRDATLAAARRR
jgi:uncharacterized damage-inducible protein DinB